MNQDDRIVEIIEPRLDRMGFEHEPEKTIDSKLELMIYAAEIKSPLAVAVTADATLCKLGDQDKEGCINMMCNALSIRWIFDKAINTKKWKWHHEAIRIVKVRNIKTGEIREEERKGVWKQEERTKEEKEYIENIKESTTAIIVNKIRMTWILNRNVDNNYLLKIICGVEEQIRETEEKPKKFLDQMKEMFGGNKKGEQPNKEAEI